MGFARLIPPLRHNPGGGALGRAGEGIGQKGAGTTVYADGRGDLDLVTYCEREGVPFTVFEDWGSILETTKRI